MSGFYLGFVSRVGHEGQVPGWDLISWFTDSPFVHCFMYYDRHGVFETTSSIFVNRALSDRRAGSNVILFRVEQGSYDKALERSQQLVGTVYDYSAFVGLGVILISERLMNWIAWPFNWVIKKINKTEARTLRLMFVGNPWHLQPGYFCSESCVDTMRYADVPLPVWWKAESMMPHQLHQYCIDNPAIFKPVALGGDDVL